MRTCFHTGGLFQRLPQNMLTGNFCFLIFFLNHWIVQLLLNLDAYIHGYTCIWHNALCIILCIYNVHFVNFSPECVSSILRLAEENNLSIIPLVQSIGHFEVGYFFFKNMNLPSKFIHYRAYINSFDYFIHSVILNLL